jgi:chromosome segregation ATPase
MKNADQIKALAVAIEEKDNQIRTLSAQQGNYEVQIAEYRQIVQELSDKLELYESKYGTVFRPARKN